MACLIMLNTKQGDDLHRFKAFGMVWPGYFICIFYVYILLLVL